MATKWTEEQLRAINTRGENLLVAAAAGSGKTAVLVERIIKMITDKNNPVDIDRLLVVTFTSAVASEMRERIGEAISKELESNPNSTVLAKQLTLLSGASITTMHSFCLDVIKNNFHELDLDPGFRIGDATECVILQNEIINDVFEDKYNEGDTSFLDLVEAYGSSKDDFKLKELVLQIYSFAMSGPWPEQWLKEKSEDFNVSTKEDLNNSNWVKIIQENINLQLESIYNSYKNVSRVCYEVEGMDKYIENVEDDLQVIGKLRQNCSQGLEETLLALNSIKFGKLKTVKKNEIQDVDSQEMFKSSRDQMKKDIAKISSGLNGISIEQLLEQTQSLYPFMRTLSSLVLDFNEAYKDKKKERNMIDFNDMEHICLQILTSLDEEGNIVPSKVALNYREKFEEVFVDEYQDSNNVQETIIDMVSRKYCDVPNVFMVGDVKQSIYRFRQARPELFLQKYNTYIQSQKSIAESEITIDAMDEAAIDKNIKNEKILLFKNFRSRKEILDAANFIFYNIMSESVGELYYDEGEALNLGANYEKPTIDNCYDINEAELENSNIAGKVELHILDLAGESKNEEPESEDEVTENVDDEENLDAIQYEARIVAKRINNLIHGEKPYLVWDKSLEKYRRATYKDIVILLRTVKSWAETIVDELGAAGIPVYSDTGSGYFDAVEIRTMMSLLHIIDNPLQDIHTLAALRSPIFSFSAEELSDLRLLIKSNEEQKYYYDIVKEIADGEREISEKVSINEELVGKCSRFIDKLNEWRRKSEYMPVDEFIWFLMMDTSYYGFVGAMSNGVKRQANLKVLFQRAKQFQQTSLKGVFNFINFINKLKKSSGDMGSAKVLGENEDVVRIMSIHKSKGLEFPVVILAGCGKQINLMDLRNDVLLHEELGYGPNFVDLSKRITNSSLAKLAIREKKKLEVYSEEIRVLYVALTRAKEKLILTGKVNDFEKTVEKWARAATSVTTDNTISPREILNLKCYLDWIAISVARHKDGEILRNGRNDIKIRDDYSTWAVELWTKSMLTVEEKLLAVDKYDTEWMNNSQIEVREEIKNRLEYAYDYEKIVYLPSNVSVSDLKKQVIEIEEPIFKLYESEYVRKPKFLSEDKGLTAAEKGTAAHFVMQHLDLDKVYTPDIIQEQIDSMVSDELLREEEAKAVNKFKVWKFFKSDIGMKVLECHKEGKLLQRELPFVTHIPASKLSTEELVDKYKDEVVRLQGIIDCFFEYKDEIVLLDYKTDYVEEGNEQKIVDRYRIQMEYYSEALEKILGRKVSYRYLYLFYLDKSIEV